MNDKRRELVCMMSLGVITPREDAHRWNKPEDLPVSTSAAFGTKSLGDFSEWLHGHVPPFLFSRLLLYNNEQEFDVSVFVALYGICLTPKIKSMEVKEAIAGTLESGDILIQISPSEEKGLHIELQSTVAYQFGRQIKQVITETLEGLDVRDANVRATDKGALDCTIRARVTAAAVRATGKDVWKD